MDFLSLCAGIEAASVGWYPLGWRCIGLSEIEPFPNAVLKYHYPEVTNYGDMTNYKHWSLNERPDVIIAGTPCQSFSIAGLRKGLADPRGNLTLTYLAIIDRYRPKWMVWENVPGVLSDKTGAFGAFLGGLAELGYGFAYRILDAQYFGVAQRRRRVFVVGYLGDWRPPAAVLFERHSLSGYPAPDRETGKGTAPTISARTKGGGGLGTDFDCEGGLIQWPAVAFEPGIASRDGGHVYDDISGTLRKGPGDNAMAVCYENHASDSRIKEIGNMAPQLNARAGTGGNNLPLVAWALLTRDSKGPDTKEGHLIPCGFNWQSGGDCRLNPTEERTDALQKSQAPALYHSIQVRRLTPVECERLQGFPDNYTNIPWRGKPTAPDGSRYKALGNSMAVPVIRWIGKRIELVSKVISQ